MLYVVTYASHSTTASNCLPSLSLEHLVKHIIMKSEHGVELSALWSWLHLSRQDLRCSDVVAIESVGTKWWQISGKRHRNYSCRCSLNTDCERLACFFLEHPVQSFDRKRSDCGRLFHKLGPAEMIDQWQSPDVVFVTTTYSQRQPEDHTPGRCWSAQQQSLAIIIIIITDMYSAFRSKDTEALNPLMGTGNYSAHRIIWSW